MEQPLRCNNQIGGYCRTQLTEEAVVTTCSHIFCLDCATKTRFANAPLHERACPVCQTALPKQDDAVHTRLTPPEDYKTSVLSGLDPSTIVDCASRALAFWTYQTMQEICYQEHLGKNLKDKYGQLSTAMDRIINEANTEISTLQNRNSALSTDQSTLQNKYDDLANLYRDKSKKCAQSQQLYDALKKRVMLRGVETAASENVTQTIQSFANQARPETFKGQPAADFLHTADGLQHHGRDDHAQPDLLGTDLRPVDYRSQQSSEIGRGVNRMAAPPRLVANRNAHVGVVNTPVQRTTLPMQGRATANRSHIPVSVRHDTAYVGHNMGSSIRYGTASDSQHRAGASTPRGFGMLSGMKVGRARTTGGVPMEPHFSRPGAF